MADLNMALAEAVKLNQHITQTPLRGSVTLLPLSALAFGGFSPLHMRGTVRTVFRLIGFWQIGAAA